MAANAETQSDNSEFNVKDTLAIFQSLSEKLTDSYHELEGKVESLKGELEESGSALSQEVSKKKTLETRVGSILNAMPVGVIILNGAGDVSEANAAARDILGDPLEGESWISIIQRCFSPTLADGHEISLKNGRFVSLATESLGDEPGQIIVINDLTDTRALQKKVNHNQKLSEMGKMTASLAHQIRTPLSTALLYADHLSNKQLDAGRQQRYANKLKDRLLQLESQVNDMLIFSKGGIMIDKKVDVNWFLQELIRRHYDFAMQQGVELSCELLSQPAIMKCNIDLLTSAYGNLIENSLHALVHNEKPTSRGYLPEVRLTAELDDCGRVIIAVVDNGGGIDESIIAKVCEPFFTTKSTGTGLGLAVVKLISSSHGGEHVIQNRVDEKTNDQGLAVSITFPVIHDSMSGNVLNIPQMEMANLSQNISAAIAAG